MTNQRTLELLSFVATFREGLQDKLVQEYGISAAPANPDDPAEKMKAQWRLVSHDQENTYVNDIL